MDGQCKCGLDGEETVGRGDAKRGCVNSEGNVSETYKLEKTRWKKKGTLKYW